MLDKTGISAGLATFAAAGTLFMSGPASAQNVPAAPRVAAVAVRPAASLPADGGGWSDHHHWRHHHYRHHGYWYHPYRHHHLRHHHWRHRFGHHGFRDQRFGGDFSHHGSGGSFGGHGFGGDFSASFAGSSARGG